MKNSINILFALTDGSSFDLENVNPTKQGITSKVEAFQSFCLQMESEHKAFASSGTKFKLPISRPCWIALKDGDKITPIFDLNMKLAKFKGYSILSKVLEGERTYTGKDGTEKVRKIYRLEANNAFVPFLTRLVVKSLARQSGIVSDLGRDIENALEKVEEKRLENKAKAAQKLLEVAI